MAGRQAVYHPNRTPGETFSGSAAVKTFDSRYLAVCVLAYVSMLVAWPAAQARPFVQPLEALLFPFRFEYPFEVYFEGRTFLNSNLPWYYLLKWFVITLPEFYFLGLAAGSVLAVIGLGKQYLKKANQFPEKWIAWVILFLVVTLPVFYVILTQPVIYDGVRQYLFVASQLAALSASVLVLFMERIRGLQVLVLVLIVLAFSVSWQLGI